MQKIRKIYCTVFRENRGRETERDRDGPKWSAKQIAEALDIKGVSDYVRVSELKKQAVQKLIDTVDHSQVLDYL